MIVPSCQEEEGEGGRTRKEVLSLQFIKNKERKGKWINYSRKLLIIRSISIWGQEALLEMTTKKYFKLDFLL